MTDLRELIEGCKRQNAKHQYEMYQMFSRSLFAVSIRYTNCRQDAEDVLQEAFVKIFQNIHTYSQDRSFEGWIRRIVINTAITHYRKNLKHAYQDDVDSMWSLKNDDEPFSTDFTSEELMNAIGTLPAGYKMVFNMYVVEGYKHQEIAEILGIDINTSKSQLSRAKKFLQRELAEMSKVYLTGYDEAR
ncbi:MAG: hypothetical protein RL226_173 [Bacteroidota bacterium]|jgi:RNA polymerase sigma-70 factor (ECF subfamily)